MRNLLLSPNDFKVIVLELCHATYPITFPGPIHGHLPSSSTHSLPPTKQQSIEERQHEQDGGMCGCPLSPGSEYLSYFTRHPPADTTVEPTILLFQCISDKWSIHPVATVLEYAPPYKCFPLPRADWVREPKIVGIISHHIYQSVWIFFQAMLLRIL